MSGTEQCDDGNTADGDTCSSSCNWTSRCGLAPLPLFEDARDVVGSYYLNLDPPLANEFWVPTADGGIWKIEFMVSSGPDEQPDGGTSWTSASVTVSQTWRCSDGSWKLLDDTASGSGYRVFEAAGESEYEMLEVETHSINYQLEYQNLEPVRRTGAIERIIDTSSCLLRDYQDDPAALGRESAAAGLVRVCKISKEKSKQDWTGYPDDFSILDGNKTTTFTAGESTVKVDQKNWHTASEYEQAATGVWKFQYEDEFTTGNSIQKAMDGTLLATADERFHRFEDLDGIVYNFSDSHRIAHNRDGSFKSFSMGVDHNGRGIPTVYLVADVEYHADPHIPSLVSLWRDSNNVEVTWNELGAVLGELSDAEREHYRAIREEIIPYGGGEHIPTL